MNSTRQIFMLLLFPCRMTSTASELNYYVHVDPNFGKVLFCVNISLSQFLYFSSHFQYRKMSIYLLAYI